MLCESHLSPYLYILSPSLHATPEESIPILKVSSVLIGLNSQSNLCPGNVLQTNFKNTLFQLCSFTIIRFQKAGPCSSPVFWVFFF